MRGKQQHNRRTRLPCGNPLNAFFDCYFPIISGLQPFLIEPGIMAPLTQVIPQSNRQRNMLIVTITDEYPFGYKRFFCFNLSVLRTNPEITYLC